MKYLIVMRTPILCLLPDSSSRISFQQTCQLCPTIAEYSRMSLVSIPLRPPGTVQRSRFIGIYIDASPVGASRAPDAFKGSCVSFEVNVFRLLQVFTNVT